jgi:ankyrin repeat protein
VSPNYRREKTGNTPLILAVREGDEEAVVDLLSQCRADPQLSNDLGRTPLMAAAASGMEHIVTLLLITTQEGAPRTSMIFQQDLSGKSSLDWARIGRRPRCIRTLQLAVQRAIEYCRTERKEKSRKESLRLLVEENRDRRVLMEHAILNRDTESVQDLACPLKHANLRWDPSNKVMALETLRRGDFDKADKLVELVFILLQLAKHLFGMKN